MMLQVCLDSSNILLGTFDVFIDLTYLCIYFKDFLNLLIRKYKYEIRWKEFKNKFVR